MGLCLLVGAVDGIVTASSVHGWYLSLTRPPATPPDFLFGPVWTALYVMMGVAAWLVWRRGDAALGVRRAVRLWGWQLLANALWTPAFFGLHSTALGLVIILVLWVLIGLTIWRFRPISRLAAALLLPYLAWVSFATYLNAGFWMLNS